jgi:hypothetical protein
MASSSKKKTTMAKLNREAAVREKRLHKQAKKNARKLEAASVVVSDHPDVEGEHQGAENGDDREAGQDSAPDEVLKD